MINSLRKKNSIKIEHETKEVKTEYTEHRFATPDRKLNAVFNGTSLVVNDWRTSFYQIRLLKGNIKEYVDFLKEIESALEKEGYKL